MLLFTKSRLQDICVSSDRNFVVITLAGLKKFICFNEWQVSLYQGNISVAYTYFNAFISFLFLLWQWKEADQSAFMDSKLKCVFDYVEDSDTPAGGNTGGTVSIMNIILVIQFSRVRFCCCIIIFIF